MAMVELLKAAERDIVALALDHTTLSLIVASVHFVAYNLKCYHHYNNMVNIIFSALENF